MTKQITAEKIAARRRGWWRVVKPGAEALAAHELRVARQNRKAYWDNILAVIAMFFKYKILRSLPRDPRPYWEAFRKASNATDEAYIAFAKQDELEASDLVVDALWDNYQALGAAMFDALDAYNDAMGKLR
jgi:hypothetical protein